MISSAYFPQSDRQSIFIDNIVDVFNFHEKEITSFQFNHKSNDVLNILATSLENLGFIVEINKKKSNKIIVPVLFGRNGNIEKHFEADALNKSERFVLEIEAGRGVLNNQFLKDLFQACMMQDVDYLGIAVRNKYLKSNDFEKVYAFFDTLYKSSRLRLPFKGGLIIGY